MRVEDLRSVVVNNDTFQNRELEVDELIGEMTDTLDRFGARRLNGYGWIVLAMTPTVVIPSLVFLLSYPLAEQSPLSRLTKRTIKTDLALEDGSVEVIVYSSRGNPRKPGDLTVEISSLSRLHISKSNFTGDIAADLSDYNHEYRGFFSLRDSEKWINKRLPSLETINIHTQLIESVAQVMSARSSHLAPAH